MTPELPTRSADVRAICEPRWAGVKEPPRIDPCGGCPLYGPCVQACPTVPGAGPHIAWIDGRNAAAAKLLGAA